MTSGAPADPPPPADDADLLAEAFFREKNVADLADAGVDGAGPSIARRLVPLVLGVVALLVVTDVALRHWMPVEDLVPWMAPEPAAYIAKVERFASSPAPDVLVLGSSRVRDGVVPDEVEGEIVKRGGPELDVYSLGLVNAKLAEWRAFARSHLPDPAPKRVVIGVTGSELVRVHGFQYAARFLWRPADLVDYVGRTSYEDFKVANVESFLESLLGECWYLFQQRLPLRKRLVETVLETVGLGENDAGKLERRAATRAWLTDFIMSEDGYAPQPDAPARSLAQSIKLDERDVQRSIPQRELVRDSEMREGSFEVLAELVADLKSQGCSVALVEMPTSPYLQALNPVLHGDVFRQRAAELCEELDIVWIAMPPSRTFLTDAMYTDVNHLDVNGARRYSRVLGRLLLASGFLDEDDEP